jgi:aldose sugar dehydrogenase
LFRVEIHRNSITRILYKGARLVPNIKRLINQINDLNRCLSADISNKYVTYHHPMKNFIFISIFFAGVLVVSTPIAQTTHQVGSTTLTESTLISGINLPWEVLWGPDDHVWVTSRQGSVTRIHPETGESSVVLSRNVMNGGSSEPGMLGMAMDPDWENNPKVYIVYCTGSSWNGTERLSVFDWNGTSLVNEFELLSIQAGGIHNGSRLMFLPDETLLMTTGDVGDGGVSSQSMSSLNGKILRLNKDGSVPLDNPVSMSYVYSYGHRNPQGLCSGPGGTIYSSEHGQSNNDELNLIQPNRNYGWPNVEGVCNTSSENTFCNANNVAEPVFTWSPCAAVNGMEYYNHPAIPEWQNSILLSVMGGFANPSGKRLSILHLSEDGLEVESEDQYFSEFNQRVRDVCINPITGAIYMALNGGSYPGSGPNEIKEFRNLDYTPPVLVSGCTYPGASNYDASANDDNGSCQFAGCLDSTALNYIAWANVDSEACVYGAFCAEDVNADGAVTVGDLLQILSAFGQVCLG